MAKSNWVRQYWQTLTKWEDRIKLINHDVVVQGYIIHPEVDIVARSTCPPGPTLLVT